jgi:hypothetical protein
LAKRKYLVYFFHFVPGDTFTKTEEQGPIL